MATGGKERHPGDTERLMSYWSNGGEGGTKIQWGQPEFRVTSTGVES
jgi:hypothetical protein